LLYAITCRLDSSTGISKAGQPKTTAVYFIFGGKCLETADATSNQDRQVNWADRCKCTNACRAIIGVTLTTIEFSDDVAAAVQFWVFFKAINYTSPRLGALARALLAVTRA